MHQQPSPISTASTWSSSAPASPAPPPPCCSPAAASASLLVDRSRLGADTLSTHALMRAGVLQLHRWGLLDRVRAAGTPPVRRTTFTYHDAVVPITIKPSNGVDALYAPRRTVLDPILVDAAAERAPTCASASPSPGSPATATAARRRDRHRRRRPPAHHPRRGSSSAPTASRSTIARPRRRARSNIAADMPAPSPTATGPALEVDGYEWIFRPDAAAGAIPTNDGQVCVFAGATPERIGRGGTDVIESIVRSSAPDLAERLRAAQAPAHTRTFRGHPGFLRKPWGNGWALVGDAGYFKDPLSAHGMTDALRDAELLARALAAALEGADEADALAGYQATRDALSLPLFDVIDTIASHQWTDAEIGDLLLRLSSAMTDEVELLAGLDAHDLPLAPRDEWHECPSSGSASPSTTNVVMVPPAVRDATWSRARSTHRAGRHRHEMVVVTAARNDPLSRTPHAGGRAGSTRRALPGLAEAGGLSPYRSKGNGMTEKNGWGGTIRGMPVEGAAAERSKRMGQRDIELFTEITGDRNPLHFDVEAARDSLFGGLIVQGGVTSGILNALVAEDLPGPGSVFLSVEWRFVKAVYIGDTITGRIEVTHVPERQAHLRARHHSAQSERRDLPVGHRHDLHRSTPTP